uniref:Uncharacterized protein n=1 Tax=Anguilla anguilla TaxID=7936 RepID=A0A0E9UG23_ANGAN
MLFLITYNNIHKRQNYTDISPANAIDNTDKL